MYDKNGVMMGVGVKKYKGRIKTQLFESDVREILNSNAAQRWFPDAQRLSSNSIGESESTFQWQEVGDQSQIMQHKQPICGVLGLGAWKLNPEMGRIAEDSRNFLLPGFGWGPETKLHTDEPGFAE